MAASERGEHEYPAKEGHSRRNAVEEEDNWSTVAVLGVNRHVDRHSSTKTGRGLSVNRRLLTDRPRERSSSLSTLGKGEPVDDIQSLVVETNRGPSDFGQIDTKKLICCAICSPSMSWSRSEQIVMTDIRNCYRAGRAGCINCRIISSGCRRFIQQNNISADKVWLGTEWVKARASDEVGQSLTKYFTGLQVRVEFQDATGLQRVLLEFFDTGMWTRDARRPLTSLKEYQTPATRLGSECQLA